ncbi:fam11a b protein [Anaeramoeba ignava]|uniref:Fam11a b protein n=1 Tax=Anaeramoeba ignava TaxID=1746090 RepID=A0A9Q0RAN1_ANAIG|nr:fam11a b protein [Anaeramoeba ignava]
MFRKEEKEPFNFEKLQKLIIQPKIENIKKEEKEEKENFEEIEKKEDCFSWLPDEILITIFSYFDTFYQIGICSSVNQQFNRVSEDWFIWKQMIGNHYEVLDFKNLLINNFGEIYEHGKLGLSTIYSKQEENLHENPQENIMSQLIGSENKKLSEDLVRKPKEIFLQQLNKFQKVMKDKKKIDRLSKRRERIESKLNIACSPLFVSIAILCIFPLPLLLISLKLDAIIKGSWFLVFIPFFVILTYSFIGFFLMAFKTIIIEDDYFLSRFFYLSSLIIIAFLVLLGLRIDSIVENINFLLISIPMFVYFVIGVYHMIKTLKYESRRIHNKNTLITDCYLLLYPFALLFFFLIFLVLLSLKLDFDNFNKKISWTSVFAPLFVADGLPIIALLVCFILKRFMRVHPDFFTMSITFLIVNILFFVSELLILLNLIGKTKIKYSLVFLPLLIPSWVFGIVLVFMSGKAMLNR